VRILIYGINFFPELTSTGKYTGEMAEWLAAGGHEVRVVTAPPYYPDWRVGEGYSGWRYRKEVVRFPLTRDLGLSPRGRGEILVHRCPLWVPARPSGLKRILHLASFALSSLPVVLRQVFWRPDVVLVVEPPLFCAPAARLVARFSRARCWLHVQDFEVDAAFNLGLLPRGLRGGVEAVERWLIRGFDRVSTISGRMMERLARKGVSDVARVFFPNWVDTEIIHPLEGMSMFRRELGIPDGSILALYSGNMGEKQGLDILVDIARRLERNHSIQFVLCGEGGERPRLQEAAKGLCNIRWLPLQPTERLNELLNLADIHLLPQRADAADLVMPSKLTGMLASGRPVVATAGAGTEVATVVAQAGLIVPPGDAGAFAEAIRLLAKNSERRVELGAAGRRYAERELAKDAVLGKFEEELQRVVHAADRRK